MEPESFVFTAGWIRFLRMSFERIVIAFNAGLTKRCHRPFSDFMDMLRRLTNCRIIIIIIISSPPEGNVIGRVCWLVGSFVRSLRSLWFLEKKQKFDVTA